MQFDPLEVGTPERILIHSSGLPYRAPASLVQTDLGSQKRQNIRLDGARGGEGALRDCSVRLLSRAWRSSRFTIVGRATGPC